MGFFAMSDLAGNDVGLLVRRHFGRQDPDSPFFGRRYPDLLDKVTAPLPLHHVVLRYW